MELRNLITFAKVAEFRSFSKAADALGYTQAAVTIQIKHLEEELTVYLFDRIGRKIHLTPKGREFLKYAKQIIDLSNHAVNAMNDDESPRGELRMGVVESLCTSVFPDIAANCSRHFPNIELIVKIGTTTDLVEMLNRNEVDLILTLDQELSNPSFITSYKRMVNIYFIVSPDHPFTKMKLQLKDILEESFIMPEKVCNCRKALEDMIRPYKNPEDLKVFLEIGNSGIIKKFVKEGLAISLLPEMTIEEDLKNGDLAKLDLDDLEIHSWLQLIHHKQKRLTVVIDSIIGIIKDTLSAAGL